MLFVITHKALTVRNRDQIHCQYPMLQDMT